MKGPRITWPGNRLAQAAADRAWSDLCRKRRERKAAKERLGKFHRRTRNKRPKWLRPDGTVDYYAYIASKEWRRFRAGWFKRHGRWCRVCTKTFNVQLHHNTYKRLGRERDTDVEAHCGGCHQNHHEQDGKTMDPLTREFVSMFR